MQRTVPGRQSDIVDDAFASDSAVSRPHAAYCRVAKVEPIPGLRAIPVDYAIAIPRKVFVVAGHVKVAQVVRSRSGKAVPRRERFAELNEVVVLGPAVRDVGPKEPIDSRAHLLTDEAEVNADCEGGEIDNSLDDVGVGCRVEHVDLIDSGLGLVPLSGRR